MSEQRIDVGAAAAVGEDADPGVGQGVQDQAVRHRGEAAEQDAPRENLGQELDEGSDEGRDEEREDTSLAGEGDTAGEREVRSARDGGAR